MSEDPTNLSSEPDYPNHSTVVFSIRYPDHVAHAPSLLCKIQEPHLISSCDEFTAVPTGQISDGYHTFDELYDHRITLWIAFCKRTALTVREAWNPTWRSKLHSDGTSIEGWFVLGMFHEPGHQITYHLPLSRWEETGFARTREMAPEWDGHTSADVLKRITAL